MWPKESLVKIQTSCLDFLTAEFPLINERKFELKNQRIGGDKVY